MNRQQNHRSALPGRQTEGALLERRVQIAFVGTTDALPCRPEPRATFDNASRRDNPARPWRALGIPLRSCACAARAMGGPAIDETRVFILRAVLAFTAWVLEPLDEGAPAGTLLYWQLMQEQAEALEAQALARGLGTEEAKLAAVRETQEAITAQRMYLAELIQGGTRPCLTLA